MTLTLNNPLTEEEWDLIEDVDFDKTNSIEFHTKHGKTVKFVKCTDERTGDLISRQAAIDALNDEYHGMISDESMKIYQIINWLSELPSAQPYTEAEIQKMQELEQAQLNKAYELGRQSVQPEPLTDKEQRMFLAAMGREEKACEEVDRNCVREPYEDSLMRVCNEIRRKVKGALWT